MESYHALLARILDSGASREDRTGTGTLSVFGHQSRYDLQDGFPLVTTKKLHVRSIVHELLWFLRGETHVEALQQAGVRIWDEWATEAQCARFGRRQGDLGPIYGHQWRNFGARRLKDGVGRPTHSTNPSGTGTGTDTVAHRNVPERVVANGYAADGADQMAWVVEEIKRNPSSRRLIVSAWNPLEAEQVALPPCHTLFQFYVCHDQLSCQLYQRSADVFLGVPFNIASYALLTHMVAEVTGLGVGSLIHTIGDAHLYKNHITQARTQLQRAARPLPRLRLAHRDSIFAFTYDDICIEGYDPHPAISAEVSV